MSACWWIRLFQWWSADAETRYHMDVHVGSMSRKIKKLFICGPHLFSKQFVCMHVQRYGFPHSEQPTYSKVKICRRFSGIFPEIRFASRTIFVPIFLFFPFYSPFRIIFFRMETDGSCWWLSQQGDGNSAAQGAVNSKDVLEI